MENVSTKSQQFNRPWSEILKDKAEDAIIELTSEEMEIVKQGSLSLFLSILAILILGWTIAPWHTIVSDISLFISGHASNIAKYTGSSFSVMFVYVIGAIAIDLIITIPIAIYMKKVQKRYGFQRRKSKSSFANFRPLSPSKGWFGILMQIVILEELFARMLFIGLLALSAKNDVMLYSFMIVGNAIWAWAHILNYDKKYPRPLLLVLPQFLGGFLLCVVFLKLGFWAAVATHFGFNAILFASLKGELITKKDIKKLLFSLILGVTALGMVYTKLPDLLIWLDWNTPIHRLPGWKWFDYLCVYVGVVSLLNALFTALLYDRSAFTKKTDRLEFYSLLGIVIVYLGVFYGIIHVLELLHIQVIVGAVAISMLLLILLPNRSPNASSRSYWDKLTSLTLLGCCFLALPWWQAGILICTIALLDSLLEHFDLSECIV